LSEEDKQTVYRARKIQKFLAQPFFVAEVFTGMAGKFVSLKDTIKGFKDILEGKYDHLPEAAFYMVGHVEEVEQKAAKMAKEFGESKETHKKTSGGQQQSGGFNIDEMVPKALEYISSVKDTEWGKTRDWTDYEAKVQAEFQQMKRVLSK